MPGTAKVVVEDRRSLSLSSGTAPEEFILIASVDGFEWPCHVAVRRHRD